MDLSRRDFLRYLGASALALGLDRRHLARIARALAADGPPILWLGGASCSGCSVSLLNSVNPPIDQFLIQTANLAYHTTLMAAAGDLAISAARTAAQAGGHILVVEGAIPTGSDGRYCYAWEEGGRPVTLAEAARALAAQAQYVVAVGTCAAYGGIPRAFAPAAAVGLADFLGRPVINIPGCPAHPDWIIGTIAHLLGGSAPALDSAGRPLMYFRRTIHAGCPLRGGARGCLRAAGCQGPITYGDCPARQWNNAQSWCVAVGAPCVGCTERTFPAFPLARPR